MDLGGIAAGFRGQQDYDLYQRKRQADQQALQIQQWEMQKYQQDMARSRQQMQRQPEIDRYAFQGLQGRPPQPPQIPIPPQDAPQPPQPGQASQPMQRPPMAGPNPDVIRRLKSDEQGLMRELSRPLNPDQKQIMGSELQKVRQQLAQLGQGMPQGAPDAMPPGGGMMQTGMRPPQAPQQPQPPQIPPYQTMAGQGQQQQQAPQISAPPQQQAPRPNSMTLQDAAQMIQGMGIKDPQMAMQVLDRMKPYLNDEAKQEAALLRTQNAQMTNQIREQGQQQRAPLVAAQTDLAVANAKAAPIKADAAATQAGASVTRAGASVTSAEAAKTRAEATVKRVEQAGGLAGFENEDVTYWAEVLEKGGTLPPRLASTPGGKALMQEVMKSVSRSGVSPTAMLSNQAEFGSEKSAQRTLGTRAANMGMAVNEASQFADLALDAAAKVPRTNFVPLNKVVQMVQTNTASPEQTAFVAANVSFVNAYAAAVSRSGGKTVHDTQEAKAMLDTAQGSDAYKAVINQLRKELAAAGKSPDIVKGDLRRDKGGSSKADDDLINKYLK